MLRIGLYQLSRPKEFADDWVVILDHTCQLGNQKCLIVLGIRLSYWRTLGRPLTLEDLSVLMIQVVDSSTGVLVEQQLHQVQDRIGRIAAIVSDQGADLVCGAKRFGQSQVEAAEVGPNEDRLSEDELPRLDADQLALAGQAKPLILKDFSHASSHIFKANLEADLDWRKFLSECGSTQPRVKQTLWGALAPPRQKAKGRYMNIGELIRWGEKMLGLLDGTTGELPAGMEQSQLTVKYGWVKKYREALKRWSELDELREQSLHVIRLDGYSDASVDKIRAKLEVLGAYESSRAMAAELLRLAREQCALIPAGLSYPGSSEVIESLIGKNKELEGQHSSGGFTKMLLTIGACATKLSENVIVEALQNVREADVRQWSKDVLGTTLGCIRRKALPGTKGA